MFKTIDAFNATYILKESVEIIHENTCIESKTVTIEAYRDNVPCEDFISFTIQDFDSIVYTYEVNVYRKIGFNEYDYTKSVKKTDLENYVINLKNKFYKDYLNYIKGLKNG